MLPGRKRNVFENEQEFTSSPCPSGPSGTGHFRCMRFRYLPFSQAEPEEPEGPQHTLVPMVYCVLVCA